MSRAHITAVDSTIFPIVPNIHRRFPALSNQRGDHWLRRPYRNHVLIWHGGYDLRLFLPASHRLLYQRRIAMGSIL